MSRHKVDGVGGDMITISVFAGITYIGIIYICKKQQDTINDLTNKLMAKDYREYKMIDRPPEPEPPKPKRQSWASDVDLNEFSQ